MTVTRQTIDEAVVSRATALGPVIREHAVQAERERRLSPPVLDGLVRAGLTKMLLPRSLGGLETDPLTCMRAIEEVAHFDAAAAWILMVANSSNWFGARFPKETVEEIWKDPSNCIMAAAFQPPVEAREASGGYKLTGRRPFASGIHSAKWLCLTGLVMDDGAPRMIDGHPVVIIAVMPTASVQVIDTWNGLGLRGSDSNDVAVQDLFVPTAWTCPMSPVFEPNAHFGSPLYRMPAMGPVVLASLAPTALAVARNAIEEVRALCTKRVPMGSMVPLRDRGAAQARLGRAEGMLRSARAFAYEMMSVAWDRARAGEPMPLELKGDLLLAAAHAAQTSAEVTDAMFAAGGSSAVFVGQPLEKLFRDSQVIRQHGFVGAGRYETVAQIMLGLEPDVPVVHF